MMYLLLVFLQATFPALHSRVMCGGCAGIVFDVGFETTVTQDEKVQWRFENIISNNSEMPLKILLVLPRQGCAKVAEEKKPQDIGLECGVFLEIQPSSSHKLQISASPSSKPVARFATLYVVSNDGVKKVGGGGVSIYWPDTIK